MPKIPGVPHLQAVRALEKAGFRVLREGKHIVMSDGRRILTSPVTTPSMPIRWVGSLKTLVLALKSSGSSFEEERAVNQPDVRAHCKALGITLNVAGQE